MDTDWTRDLTPDEAQAALDALNAKQGVDYRQGSRRTSEAEKGARGQGQKTAYPTKRQCVITGKINLFVMHDTAGADNRN
jgi:hypothetical protein